MQSRRVGQSIGKQSNRFFTHESVSAVGVFYKLSYDSRKILVTVAHSMLTVSFKRDCNLESLSAIFPGFRV